MSSQLLKLIESVTRKLTIDRVERLTKSSPGICKDLYHGVAGRLILSEKERLGEVRPYFDQSPAVRIERLLPKGRPLTERELEDIGRFITRNLLYAHSVAIDDPLTPGLFGKGRWDLYNSLLLIARFRDLVKRDWLVLVPTYKTHNCTSMPGSDIWRVLVPEIPDHHDPWNGVMDNPITSKEIALFRTSSMREIASSVMHHHDQRLRALEALRIVDRRLHIASMYAGRLDVLFENYQEEALAYEIGTRLWGNRERRQSNLPKSAANRVLTLQGIPKFQLEGLKTSELVALRTDNNYFSEFRLALSNGLEAYARYWAVKDIESANFELREALEPVIQKAVDRRPTLELPVSSSALQQFVYGAIPVGASALSGSLAAGLGAAAVVGASQLIWGYARSWSKRRTSAVGKTMQGLLEAPSHQDSR